MNPSKVILLRCPSYDQQVVDDVIHQGFELLGGVGRFVKADEKILLKPNLLASAAPHKCVTTHPAVFAAVAKMLKGHGCQLSYGDSPALSAPLATAKKAGIAEAAAAFHLPLADFLEGKEVLFEKGFQNKKFFIANGALEADGIISIAKMKTHGFQKFTGAVKNQFGCVPGMQKGEYHVKLSNPDDFAKMLLDINRFLSPRLYIMDGVMAMDGNGPSGGNPIAMNVLLFSADPIALDATVCRMIHCAPEFVPTIQYGGALGLGSFLAEEIEIGGQALGSFTNSRFKIDRNPLAPQKLKGLFGFAKNRLVPKPYILEKRCIKCGKCVQICPVAGKALHWQKSPGSAPPLFDYAKCIRCFCCQEICPESAIEIYVPLARRMINKF